MLARTASLWLVLSLGLWWRKLRVIPSAKCILIEDRILWFFKRKRSFHFKNISHFDYGYNSMSTSWDIFGNSHDSVENYQIGLVLTNRDTVHLFSFRGEGSSMTGLGGVLMGDSLWDYQGDQGARSLGLVDALREATGKELSPPSLSRFQSRTRY